MNSRNREKQASSSLSADEKVAGILQMVMLIPKGRVATYGQIARLAGIPRNSRQVGTVLKSLPCNDRVPWFRVVNSQGRISERNNRDSEQTQRLALEEEGVEISESGRIRLAEFQWDA